VIDFLLTSKNIPIEFTSMGILTIEIYHVQYVTFHATFYDT
jgi:hypothetical protein